MAPSLVSLSPNTNPVDVRVVVTVANTPWVAD